jgi:divalent metal cation (Fe/Co/Zn/Cd) transporter
MAKKITAAMLIATALPSFKAQAHFGDNRNVPVTGYLYLMIAIGATYFLFLVFRQQRKNIKTRR